MGSNKKSAVRTKIVDLYNFTSWISLNLALETAGQFCYIITRKDD